TKSFPNTNIEENDKETIFYTQILLEFLKLNKSFEIKNSNDQNLNNQLSFSSIFSKIKGGVADLFNIDQKDCSQTITYLQIDPKDKNKKGGPYNVCFVIRKEDQPLNTFYKVNDLVKISNTNFDGDYKINKIVTKGDKITSIFLNVPYRPIYRRNQFYDSTYKNRLVIEPKNTKFLECSQSKGLAFVSFKYGEFNDDMKVSVMNFQLKNNLEVTGIIDEKTAHLLVEEFKLNFKKIFNSSYYQQKIVDHQELLGATTDSIASELDKTQEKIDEGQAEIDRLLKSKEQKEKHLKSLENFNNNKGGASDEFIEDVVPGFNDAQKDIDKIEELENEIDKKN
ncbi:MAG: hypothetical protein RLZ10_1231, partial [Bacteroidota bacterium]